MKKKGFTLIELIVGMVIVAIIGLAITVFFIAEYRFCSSVKERIKFAREARIATNHMTRVLRFAIPGTVTITTQPDETIDIYATVAGGHLDLIGADDTEIHYQYNPGQPGTLDYEQPDGANNIEIATDLTYFDVAWNEPEFTIELTAGGTIPLKTKIRVLPE